MAKPLIDWYNSESHIPINPRLPEATRNQLYEVAATHSHLKGHIWIASSGTESFPKMIALSKEAMLTSAKAVNDHLQAQEKDAWLNVLPLFHVGGLGIYARAELTKSTVIDHSDMKWDPMQYASDLVEFHISFSSLTPTHVYDLVSRQVKAPKALKSIIVGGGHLSEKLHEQAFVLGWPLLRSYGMTEVCAQIATAKEYYPLSPLVLLNHITLRFTSEEFIEIKSPALLTGLVHGNDPLKTFIDPKADGWYTTQDKGSMAGELLQILGRGTNFMKIGGENINFSQLEAAWETIVLKHNCCVDIALIDLPDERLGRKICLAVAAPKDSIDLASLIEEFHHQVLPLAKIRTVFFLDALPRTELFKLKKNVLRATIESLSL